MFWNLYWLFQHREWGSICLFIKAVEQQTFRWPRTTCKVTSLMPNIGAGTSGRWKEFAFGGLRISLFKTLCFIISITPTKSCLTSCLQWTISFLRFWTSKSYFYYISIGILEKENPRWHKDIVSFTLHWEWGWLNNVLSNQGHLLKRNLIMPGQQGSNNYPRQTGKHGHRSKGGNVFGLCRATHGLNYRYTYITQAVPPPSVGSASMSCASVHLAGT